MRAAAAAIARHGERIEDPNGAGDGSLWGVVPSGLMDMSPALVRVVVEQAGPGRCRVHVRASGREGLIGQGIGAKAADRIAAELARGA